MEERRDQPEYLKDSPASEPRVAFVSRSAAAPAPAPGEARPEAEGQAPPRLLSRATGLLFLLAIALQAFSWWQLQGYQLADSVEYMERALAFARGEQLQAGGAVRSLGFSSLLVPFFAAAEALGLEDLRSVVHLVRLFQMLLGLGLVFVCVRVGARLGGRRVGWAAGILCATNPVFLQYSVSPVSGVAAAFCVGLGLDALLVRTTRKHALLGGLALGAAFLMAYQTLLITGTILALLALRDRRGHLGHVGAAGGGFLLGILAQVVLDKLSYGVWGVSVGNYLVENVGGVTTSLLVNLGLEDRQWVKDLYAAYAAHLEASAAAPDESKSALLQPLGWYFSELPSMLVWPVLGLGLLGLVRSWVRMSWRSSLLVVTLFVNVAAMSMKGSKSYRLWLPLLPMIAPLCGWGYGLVLGLFEARPGRHAGQLGRLVGAAILIAATGLGVRALLEVDTRRYGAYWDAMDYVNGVVAREHARQEAEGRGWSKQRVCAAYHWAVFGRNSADLGLAKLSEHLDSWRQLDEQQREQLLLELTTSHWLILHEAVLTLDGELADALNDHFEVATTFWSLDTDPALRDVLVLRNTSPDIAEHFEGSGKRPRRFWEFLEGRDPEVYRREQGLDDALPVPQSFVGAGRGGATERLTLLGWDYERLPDCDYGWITYHWYTETGFERDYTLIDRLTVPEMHSWWRNDHPPGRGFRPTSSWSPGTIYREGFVLLPAEILADDDITPIGGAFRRGDLIPVTLWIKCREAMDESEREEERPDAAVLRPVARGSDLPLEFAEAPGLSDDVFESADGHLAMRDGLVRIGEFFLPVAESFALPDDGRPVED